MKRLFLFPVVLLAAVALQSCLNSTASAPTQELATMEPIPTSIYDFKLPNIEGQEISFDQYKGKVLVLVNVASRCGYTPQYADLQQFYDEYKDRGVVVMGFPANNFGGQEPGSNEEIQEFCTSKFSVTFPMFSKISVRGDDMHPLYTYLTEKDHNGVMDSDVSWNFNKYIIDREGRLVHHFKSGVNPSDDKFRTSIEELL